MRVIKLSSLYFYGKDEKKDDEKSNVNDFFEKELINPNNRDYKGKFRITKGRIDKQKFNKGEKLIFTFDSEVVYLSYAASGISENDDKYKEDLPFCFTVDVKRIYKVEKMTLENLEQQIREIYPGKNILINQSWPIIEENEEVHKLWNNLIKNKSILVK